MHSPSPNYLQLYMMESSRTHHTHSSRNSELSSISAIINSVISNLGAPLINLISPSSHKFPVSKFNPSYTNQLYQIRWWGLGSGDLLKKRSCRVLDLEWG
ncbi:hypothetical protein Droror1_Dr00010526 [Drosera rotundifolia]